MMAANDRLSPARKIGLWFAWSGGVVLGLLLLVVALAYIPELIIYGTDPAQIPFDQKRWAEPRDVDSEIRWQMHKDLRTTYLRQGMTVDEVEDLLGRNEPYRAEMKYKLRERGFVAFAADFLILEVDDTGHIANFYVDRQSY